MGLFLMQFAEGFLREEVILFVESLSTSKRSRLYFKVLPHVFESDWVALNVILLTLYL